MSEKTCTDVEQKEMPPTAKAAMAQPAVINPIRQALEAQKARLQKQAGSDSLNRMREERASDKTRNTLNKVHLKWRRS